MRIGQLCPWQLLIASVLISDVCAEIFSYKNYQVHTQWPVYHEIAQYAPGDIFAEYAPGNGRSYIDISALKLSVHCEQSPSRASICPNVTEFEINLFKKPTLDNEWLGYWSNQQYCCTPTSVTEGLCTTPGRLIIPKQINGTTLQTIVQVSETSTRIGAEDVNTLAKIKHSGLYILMMALCDPEVDNVVVDGSIECMNPYGYLPGDVFGCLIFFGVIALIYLVIGVVWFVLSAVYMKELMAVQMWITLVIFMGMLESAVLYFDYLTWNQKGTRDVGTMVFGVIVGVSKRALSRILVLLVSMGYGIVLPSLGQNLTRVLSIGGAYCLLSLTYSLLANVPSSTRHLDSPSYMDLLALLTMLVAAVDTIVYVWVLQSLTALIQSLESRKQAVKLRIYKRFRLVLFVSLLFAVIWAVYGVYVTAGEQSDAHWRERWTIDAVWEVCYVFILAAIAFLWAPTRNSQRYAHSVELTGVDDDEADRFRDDEYDEDDAEYGGPLPDATEGALRVQTIDVHAAANKMR